MKKFSISAAFSQFGEQLSKAQKNSSLFSEAPVIAGKVLRRGVSIVLSEVQYLAQKAKLDALVKAGAITIQITGTEGKAEIKTSVDTNKPLDIPKVEAKVDMPKEIVPEEIKAEITDTVKTAANDIASSVSKEFKKERKNKQV